MDLKGSRKIQGFALIRAVLFSFVVNSAADVKMLNGMNWIVAISPEVLFNIVEFKLVFSRRI